jgi:hypothetical protein
MNELAWLVGHHFQSLVRREYDWVVAFDKDATLVVECLWRLVEAGRIRFTSKDDGQQFGLPAPVDAAAEVNARLAGATVEGVEMRGDSSTSNSDLARDTYSRSFPIRPDTRRGTCPAAMDKSLQLAGES